MLVEYMTVQTPRIEPMTFRLANLPALANIAIDANIVAARSAVRHNP
jgi:hypothetical protein